MKLRDITAFICSGCLTWRSGTKCEQCGRSVMPGNSCKSERGDRTTFGCYRPPRPRHMTPIQYRKRYGCVDDNFTRVTNGRYYCNPAHCSRSFKNKRQRDKHLKMAYAILM